jgi:hypothetical protein
MRAVSAHIAGSCDGGARRGFVTSSSIDHLVVACADLAQGGAWAEAVLGVPAQAGGKHPLMGTHNRLLRLGQRVYLELIAIDPDASAQRPRWFGLDTRAVRERMASGPYLLTWVASCSDVVAAAAREPCLGEVIAATRGAFSWRITVPGDGRLNFDGVLPTLIQWDGSAHPGDGLDDRGCALLDLQLAHPQAEAIRPLLKALQLRAPVRLQAGDAAIVARVRTPNGVVELR